MRLPRFWSWWEGEAREVILGGAKINGNDLWVMRGDHIFCIDSPGRRAPVHRMLELGHLDQSTHIFWKREHCNWLFTDWSLFGFLFVTNLKSSFKVHPTLCNSCNFLNRTHILHHISSNLPHDDDTIIFIIVIIAIIVIIMIVALSFFVPAVTKVEWAARADGSEGTMQVELKAFKMVMMMILMTMMMMMLMMLLVMMIMRKKEMI